VILPAFGASYEEMEMLDKKVSAERCYGEWSLRCSLYSYGAFTTIWLWLIWILRLFLTISLHIYY
jgi:hypothetical protein